MKTIKPLLFLALCMMLINSVGPGELPAKEKKYLPKVLKKVKFGMSLEQLNKVRKGNLVDVSDAGYDFRKEYREDINRDHIETVVYYLDNNGVLPLYEMIIEFDSEASRDAAAQKLLGAPNYKEKDWKIDIDGFYPLHAWAFQKKLVYAIPMDGSEWENGLE